MFANLRQEELGNQFVITIPWNRKNINYRARFSCRGSHRLCATSSYIQAADVFPPQTRSILGLFSWRGHEELPGLVALGASHAFHLTRAIAGHDDALLVLRQ